jgi:ubiquinone/menaquinone biosynthesis C-methylase UbiE
MALLKLRKIEPGEPLIAAMTAVRMGDRLLIIGCGATKVIAQIAARPGITGRACAMDDDADRTARAAAAAQREGALLEVETASFTALPFERDAFDVVVVNHLLPRLERNQRAACVAEAVRVVRGGGRCVVVQAGRSGGLAGIFGGSPRMTAAEVEGELSSAGFRAVRTIAEREGLLFVEGARRAGD